MNQPPGQSVSIRTWGDACSKCGKKNETADDVLVRVTCKSSGGYVYTEVCVPCLVEWKKDLILKVLKDGIVSLVRGMIDRVWDSGRRPLP